MISKLATKNSLFLAGALVSFGATAHADNINTSGVVCRNSVAAQALDIEYVANGAQNANSAPRSVTCAVPRSPIPAGSAAVFYVDGHNNPGTSTGCALTVFDFHGAVVAAQAFNSVVPPLASDWDIAVTFPAGLLGTFDYATLVCTIPGNRAGSIHGITAAQFP